MLESNVFVKINQEKNRLYLTLKGFVTEQSVDMDTIVRDIQNAIDQLKPGFDIINDIREFKPTSQDTLDNMKRIMAYMETRGLRRIIRVIGGSVIGKMQLQRVSKESYTAEVATSVEAAERMLDADKS